MTGSTTPVTLSVLDQSPITDHLDRTEALQESLRLAERAEREGYRRIWYAEHHHSMSFASPAPETMTALALERTTRIRVGTGGILLPLYTPQKVAETMGLLQRVHGDRVDIGIGRAALHTNDFPHKVETLLSRLPEGMPQTVTEPEHRVWVLGAGGTSAPLAASLGAGYVQGHFLSPSSTPRGMRAYWDEVGKKPGFAVIAVRAVTADTAEKAQRLAAAAALWRARKDLNYDSPIPSLEHAERDKEWSDEERARAVTRENGFIHGTPEHVRDQLLALAEQHRASEIMVNTLTSDPADRDASYTLLADAFDQAAVGVA
ncbi:MULTISPECIES: MsnO8 family LLM class oxidoreductase [Actinomycetes]|uniref:Luciferase family oxidoreductase, group 1 n=4 Tax=Actinomycetes TaxID=1760 RepID=A0A2H1IDN8_BRELN|nr:MULTISPECIES: MsnO8 family LLM class oxidoreductase [Actinomycetes]MDN5586003.1 LLM class flavin-dependent oxidoreductase [Brevibacterium sp.]AHI20877.1 luciferase-like monooxygenase [Corynebacterium casei LMG S-19264]SMX69819.1 luciferase family oxidoreductase, group 1 [Brevibacterium antiquum]SMX73265.1 luciferase family oxidoreductase, group 1 [Brevibacterium linens ATCC 9172]SMY04917.1 luciferase family oxidoreductase, group 1 [Brevibacterium antiquum CNRZ 918]